MAELGTARVRHSALKAWRVQRTTWTFTCSSLKGLGMDTVTCTAWLRRSQHPQITQNTLDLGFNGTVAAPTGGLEEPCHASPGRTVALRLLLARAQGTSKRSPRCSSILTGDAAPWRLPSRHSESDTVKAAFPSERQDEAPACGKRHGAVSTDAAGCSRGPWADTCFPDRQTHSGGI